VDSQAKQQGVRFDLELPDHAVEVVAAEDHIHQALLNLAVNALEELGDDDTGRLTISLDVRDETVELRVVDNGAGIPEEVQDSLFDLHVTTKDSGTGIGLYVARMAVEEAGGSLDVERTGRDGTTFRIMLPVAKGDD
jgi:signal transduction histidine kinase